MKLTSDRVAALLRPFLDPDELSSAQLGRVELYLALLLKWNSKMNLTAVRDPEEIVARHFGESFFAARHLFSGPAIEEVADLGSGAGFPGLPLKIWNSSIRLTLIEANQRKAAFLREAVRDLKLENVAVKRERAEKISSDYDLVTLRAVESFQEILPVAESLVRKGGRLALLIGEGQVDIARASLPDLAWNEPIAIPGSTNRCLLIAQVN